MLKVTITGAVSPSDARARMPRGEYLATEIKRSVSADGVSAVLAESVPIWRLRKVDALGRLVPSGPAFVLSFRELADHIGAKHIKILEGDFV